MTNDKLVELINECLNNNSQIDFHSVSEFEADFNNYINNDRDNVMRVRGVLLENMYLPIHGVWHANYDIHDFENNEPLGNCIEVPLEILDKFRHGKDPDILNLFIHYRDSKKLDVYVLNGSIN